MAKKKNKAVSSARGFATSSIPSKKTVPPAVKEPPAPSEPLSLPVNDGTNANVAQDNRSGRDHAELLVSRFASLHGYKTKSLLEKLNHVDKDAPSNPIEFQMTSEMEHALLTVLQQKDRSTMTTTSRQRRRSLDNDKMIGCMDVIYLTLLELGFDAEDIDGACQKTVSSEIEDYLEWLCMHVPYERMPVGFYQKYYNDKALTINVDINRSPLEEMNKTTPLDTERRAPQQPTIDEPTVKLDVQVKKEELPEKLTLSAVESNDNVYKAKIMNAAQAYMEDEETVNDKYANIKVERTLLAEQLPSKKNRKKQPEPVDKSIIQKRIKELDDQLRRLETDWEFDSHEAEALYVAALEKAQQTRRDEQKAARSSSTIPKTADAPAVEKNKEPEENDDDLDDGLFGGLMMETLEQQEPTQTSTTTVWRMIQTDSSNWKGRFPKDALQEHCIKTATKPVYTSHSLGGGRWRAAVALKSSRMSVPDKCIDMPDGIAVTSQKDAEQVAALFALFELGPHASIYQVFHSGFKDLWLEWKEEKIKREQISQQHHDLKRIQFLIDCVNADSEKRQHYEKGHNRTGSLPPLYCQELPEELPKVTEKHKRIFSRVKSEFKKRLSQESYQKMKTQRQDLPMAAFRNQVLELVNKHQVVVISGETGCGKSTQVPQFIAEDLLSGTAEYGSVICTQPRRISAMSIANRVSVEMGDKPRATGTPGSMVGYQIRLESRTSEDNVLVFCTTGILLRRLESDRYLDGVSHVVVDEVHERTMESDFLLVILQRLRRVRPDLRIILMSATVETDRFSRYFDNCPVLSVPGRTFPVHVHYLEDVVEATGYTLEEDSEFAHRRRRIRNDMGRVTVSGKHGTSQQMNIAWYEEDSDSDDPYSPHQTSTKLQLVSQNQTDNEEMSPSEGQSTPKYSRQTFQVLKRLDENKINYDLIQQLLDYICGIYVPETLTVDVPQNGAILVFLPGMPEIRRLHDILASHPVLSDSSKYWLVPLHSSLSSEQQERAFEIPPAGVRKIVLSTNIAETGVTISDVTIVIDTGMAKVVSYDDRRNISQLRQTLITQANARQRRGRAGRVQEGVVFHLFTKDRFEEMAAYETPEIMRMPLEELCLRIRMGNMGTIHDVLSTALDPPSEKRINMAIQTLQEVQALTTDGHETLTALGVHLAHLPVDVHVGKMILYGAIFQCLDPVLTVAAALSYKSPFVRPFGKEHEADEVRKQFEQAPSDFWTIYHAYSAWRDEMRKVQGQRGWIKKMHAFCSARFLSQRNLETIEDLKKQYLGLLMSIGFVKRSGDTDPLGASRLCHIPSIYNTYATSLPVVHAAIAAGLYPHIGQRLPDTNEYLHENLKMSVHSSSVLSGRYKGSRPEFLIYHMASMTNDKVSVYETAATQAATVLLMTAKMDIKHVQQRVILDNWINLKCYARTAVLAKGLRTELDQWLRAKMKHPDLDLIHHNEEIMGLLVKFLEGK